MIGALSEAVDLPVTTAVTCPTVRMHPAVVAQAAATAAVQHDGRFVLGVGSGEALNEHIYTLPDEPVPIYVSGFGAKATDLAGRIGDGFVCTMPDAELADRFRAAGGAGKPAQGGFKVCHADTEDEGIDTAYRIWPNAQLPGELSQVLPHPRHFEQASELVTRDMIAGSLPCGPDPEPYRRTLQSYVDAGFDEVYVAQIGPRQDEFFDFWRTKVLG